MHCNRRRLVRRGQEFHVCTINKSAHTKKSANLFNDPRTTATFLMFLTTNTLINAALPIINLCNKINFASQVNKNKKIPPKIPLKTINRYDWKRLGVELREDPATTITDADYADDIAILANTPDQAETLLHSLERAAAGIGLYVNAHKTEYMCNNQKGDISTLDGTPLKLVDKFTYLGSSVESTEKDIKTRLTKAGPAINRLSIIWKSDLTD